MAGLVRGMLGGAQSPEKVVALGPERGDLIVQVYLYEDEQITVLLNDSLFYTRTVKPGGARMFEVRRRLPREKISKLELRTERHGKVYLDTSNCNGDILS